MNKLVDKLFKGIDYFTGILTGLMVFFVFLNVVLRTFFNAGLTWSEELARYLFVYVTYIGAISAMRANAHLGVDTLISRMKPQVQMVMYIGGTEYRLKNSSTRNPIFGIIFCRNHHRRGNCDHGGDKHRPCAEKSI